MSDTTGGALVTGTTDSSDGGNEGPLITAGIPALASTLRGLAVRAPTQAELAEIAENPLAQGAVEQAMLSRFGQGIKSGVAWIRSQFVNENMTAEEAANALSKFDAVYGFLGRGFGFLADATPVLGVAAIAIDMYPVVKGIPDTQVATLRPGSLWNPEGGPPAPLQLANVPLQVIYVATEAQLTAAINTVNASPGNYAIHITSSIVLTGNLPTIAQPMGSVQIDGKGNLLYGSNTYRGLVVDGTNATIENLTIQDAVATGGAAGQDGAGVLAINNAHVALHNVTFANDRAQLGGGALADASSSISVQGGSFSSDTATGGQATSGASGASSSQGDGSAIFLAGVQALPVTAKPGQTTTFTGGIADQDGQGGIAALVAQGGGTVVLSGTESFSGGVILSGDTTLVLAAMGAAGSGNITFASQGTGTLQIDPAALDPNKELFTRLSGMMAGDRVDFVGLSGATQLVVQPPSGSTTASTDSGPPATAVTVSNGTQTETLLFTGLNAGAQFALSSDNQGGTVLTMTQSMPTPSALSETTANGVVSFSGTAQAGTNVTLYQIQLDTKILLQLGTATVASDGQFSLTPGTQPDAGAGPVTAVATDSYGNASGAADVVSLPAGVGGSPPVAAPGMVAPIPGSIVVRVGTEAQLIAAINEANSGAVPTSLAIEFTNNITLSGTQDLPALEDKAGVQIVGNGFALQGDGNTRGFLVFGGNVTIDDLTIADTVALGGAGGGGAAGGGGGAGLGGGLLVVGDSNVTIDDVNFVDDRAIGGAGGPSASTAGGGFGGGGGLGGAGGSAMSDTTMDISGGGGGVGIQATGGSGGPAGQTSGGAGVIGGAPSDQSSGADGGVDGGGGAGGTETSDGMDGGGGGNYGLSGSDASEGGWGSTAGWGGGGGGNYQYGGNGGFGGGGGSSSHEGGHGGFGGGGGGGTPLFSDEGAPGGFGGGAGSSATNNSDDDGGGGGMGAGGSIFVGQGSSLTVEDSSSSGGSVQGGQGESGGQDGRAYGSGIFIEGNQSLVLEATAGQTTRISDVIADETGSHDASGATGAGSLIIEGKGTVALDASNTYTGGTVITNGTLELGAASAAGSGNITFIDRFGALKIDPAATQVPNAIAGFSHGDSVDLAGLAWSGDTSAKVISTSTTPAGTSMTVVGIGNPGGQQQQLVFQGLAANATFVTASDGQGGTKLTLARATSAAGVSSGAAGHASTLGSNDARADLSVALERTPPVPGVVVSDADSGADSAAAGQDPTPEAALVALPGTDEHQTIAPAVQDGQGNTSVHHTR